ncbi:MAG: hypothetical protein ABJA67_17045 [Chthonomonadales bacterium]
MKTRAWSIIVGALLIAVVSTARADRNILAPRALITPPESPKIEGLFQVKNTRNYLSWANVGFDGKLIGLELEAERFELGGHRNEALSFQYSLTGNAFTDLAPAIALGVRDVFRTGRDKQAIFAVASKSFGLSKQQEQLVRDFKVHLGVGSSTLGGLFGGIQVKFKAGFTVQAEIVSLRYNASLSVPVLTRGVSAKAASLNGAGFFGAEYKFKR